MFVERHSVAPFAVRTTDLKKGIMKPNAGREYNKILINHWRWLESQGPSYKQQATSCKRQAASLTRKLYNDILQYKGERLCKQKKL
jgi:hypothetical protein